MTASPSSRRAATPTTVAALAGATLYALSSPAALACSTCKCGDYTITLFGAEKPFESRFRVGLDYLHRSETQGDGIAERETDEDRVTLGLAYSVTQDLTLAVQIPWVSKEIENGNLARVEADGIGDIDVIGRYVLYRAGSGSGRHLAGVRVGVRLPTADEVKEDGEKLDIDVQPDAGAWVPNLGGWYSYFRFPWFLSTTLTYFSFGDGNQDFSPGDAVVGSVLAQYGLNQTWALQAGIDARHSEKNQFSGVDDDDSGGTLAMVFVGAAARLSTDFVLHAGVQLPLIDELNGEQEEDPVFRAGVAYDF